ncbi:hypothetical protein LPJ66_000396 [Kickxella alabastrina]|uniref:Uncharacterized protein n=1 Tax=Kickxella alabastrina TaxID=61397 RepID=A0ACC1IW28_9FUNG|nr:hypothetical protein LPJ66_000396 [Kickxella alabastrina]
MLANSANSSNDSSSTTEASRALHALNQALPYAHSIAERSQLELSINLHQHHHQSLLHHHKQLHTLQTTLTRAQSALKQSQQGQLNDQQRLRRLQSDSVFSLMAPLRKKERESAQNALGFSDMMVERAQRDVMRVEAEIGTMREKFEESSRRMRDECWMAEQACQGVLRRAGMVAETQQQPAAVTPLTPPLIPPVPPPPPPPPPTPPDLPQSNQITTHRYTAAKQRPPPPPPQSQRPFSISADTSFEIQASLHHFQSTLPPELLHPLATPPPPSTSTGSAGSATTINFSTSLWHALYMTLRYIYPHAEVTLDQGNALFGADAYLNLQTTIRLPQQKTRIMSIIGHAVVSVAINVR